jgi:hypothetical protein
VVATVRVRVSGSVNKVSTAIAIIATTDVVDATNVVAADSGAAADKAVVADSSSNSKADRAEIEIRDSARRLPQ